LKIDLNYASKVNKEYVQRYWLERDGDPGKVISTLATSLNIPCLTIAFWIAEVAGYPDSIKETVDGLINFYGYTLIENKPSNCPW